MKDLPPPTAYDGPKFLEGPRWGLLAACAALKQGKLGLVHGECKQRLQQAQP